MRKHYPSKTNNEKMGLYNLIAFAMMAHMYFDDVYKKAYSFFINKLNLFLKVR